MKMNENNCTELLKRGLSEYYTYEFSFVPPKEDINHEFSEKYLKEKEKLIRNVGISYWKYVNTAAKKAAAIILTLLFAITSFMSVKAVREKVFDFIYNVCETFTEFISNQEIYEGEIEKYYTLSLLPQTYTKKLNQKNIHDSFNVWSNEKNQDILLTQFSDTSGQQFNSEYGELTEKVINDTPCLVCENEKDYFCYWEFDGYRFELIYPTELGEEFMKTVVGHLVETK